MTAVMLLPPVSKSIEIRTKQGAGESSERLSELLRSRWWCGYEWCEQWESSDRFLALELPLCTGMLLSLGADLIELLCPSACGACSRASRMMVSIHRAACCLFMERAGQPAGLRIE